MTQVDLGNGRKNGCMCATFSHVLLQCVYYEIHVSLLSVMGNCVLINMKKKFV